MTDPLDTAERAVSDAIREFTEDVERYQAIKQLETRIERIFKTAKAEVATNLHQGRSWKQVGELLGVTGSRAEQISRGTR
jgi:DNA-directed RNA polymerase specialized sigma subunit